MALIDVRAPMVASVFEILVSVGDEVSADQELIVLESMKMEVPVSAGLAGRVAEVLVQQSTPVSEGDVLIRLEVTG